MNSLERIKAAIRFRDTDRPPVIPQIFGHAALFCDVPLLDYLRQGAILAACQLKAQNHYGHDALFAFMDACVESEALGSTLTFPADQYPDIGNYAFNRETDLQALEIPDPHRAGRMPELLKAITILREQAQDDLPIVGCVLGPMTLSGQLLSLETALYLAIDETERFESLLDFCSQVAISFGIAQIRAGAHLPLIFEPAACPEVIPKQFFRELIAPRLKRIFTALKTAGSLANWLHIAGQTETILPFYPEMGVDIANFDYCVQPQTAQDLLPDTCLDGNLRPYGFVRGEPEAIRAETSALLEQFRGRGGFILSSGCEIPLEARPENIAAMVECTRRRG